MCLFSNGNKNPDTRQKNRFYFKQFYFQKIPKLKSYYAKWTLPIEVTNGKKINYCIFRVYLVTGTKNPDISQEGTSRIPKYFFLSRPGVLQKIAKPILLGYFLDSHRLPGSSARAKL
jgi:hypothetical protein